MQILRSFLYLKSWRNTFPQHYIMFISFKQQTLKTWDSSSFSAKNTGPLSVRRDAHCAGRSERLEDHWVSARGMLGGDERENTSLCFGGVSEGEKIQ